MIGKRIKEDDDSYTLEDLEINLIDELGNFVVSVLSSDEDNQKALVCFQILKWIHERKENTTTENSDVKQKGLF